MKRIISFIKKETVLSAAMIFAVISAFFVAPDAGYIGYIDFRTLAVLLSLMIVMAEFKELGVFDLLARKMLSHVSTVRSLTLILVMLCFFFSMLITNDVALITFIPFTITVLELADERKMLIPIAAMQTVAANLGSMLTPLGNPQNLYLYSCSGMNLGSFVLLMLPYAAASFFVLAAWCLFRRGGSRRCRLIALEHGTDINARRVMIYIALFVVCMLCVLRVLHYAAALIIVITVSLIADRRILLKVDYSLLLTFTAFFIFIGNMGRIGAFSSFLRSLISGREVATSVAASQIISNVPAALLLSGFTDNIGALIIGTNIGGLGTLIASMASLITFKYIARFDKSLRGRYILYFTVSNIALLVLLCGLYAYIKP